MNKKYLYISVFALSLVSLPVFLFIAGQTQNIRQFASATLASVSVPTFYSPLYSYMQTTQSSFSTTLDTQNTGSLVSPTYGTDLLLADENRGPDLYKASPLNYNCPDNYLSMCGIKIFLDRMQELGVQGMSLNIGYPLVAPTYASQSAYLNYFKSVVTQVRSHGMKVLVEQGVVFAHDPTYPTFQNYTFPPFCQYEDEQHKMSQIIIDNLHPDYLQIHSEPDTNYTLTQIPEMNPATTGATGSAAYVNYLLGNRNDSRCAGTTTTPLIKGTTKITAGTGAWIPTDYSPSHGNYTQLFSQIANLDAIDIHTYPTVNENPYHYMQNIIDMADTANAAGKRITISEAWASKENANDLTGGSIASDHNIFKRDSFSFWQPIDQQFLLNLSSLAKIKHIDYISPFWSWYFFSYLTYTPGTYDENTSATALSTASTNLAVSKMQADSFSTTGLFYKNLIAGVYGIKNASIAAVPASPTVVTGATTTVDIIIDGGGRTTNTVSATVVKSNNLTIQSIAPGDCALAETTSPTTTNLSFAGTIATPTTRCTAYSITFQTLSPGIGTIEITKSSSSVKSSDSSVELLLSTQPASITITGSALTPTPTITPIPTNTPIPPTFTPTPLPFLPLCNCAGKNVRVKNIKAVQGGARVLFAPTSDKFIFDRPGPNGLYDVVEAPVINSLTSARNITKGKTAPGLPTRNRSNPVYHPSGNFIIFKAEADTHYLMGQVNRSGFDYAFPGYGGFSDWWATDPTGTRYWKLTNYPIKQLSTDNIPIYSVMDPRFSADGNTFYWAESNQTDTAGYANWKIKSATFRVDSSGNPSLSSAMGTDVYDPLTMATHTGGVGGGLYVNIMDVIDADTLLIVGNPNGGSQYGMDEYILHIASHSLTNLTNTPLYWDEGSAVTANKRAVVYMTNRDSIYTLNFNSPDWSSGPMQRDYYLVSTDGTGTERLTYFNDPTAPEYVGHNALAIDPSFSPDGKYMLVNLGIDFSNPLSTPRQYEYEIALITLENNFPAPIVTPTSTPTPTNTPVPPTITPTSTPTPILIVGDINGDGHVDVTDLSILADNFGLSGTNIKNVRADINKDGTVDVVDLSLLADHFGQ